MITQAEKDALLKYMEFLLVKELLEPIVDKHIEDRDVVGACFDTVFAIIDEIGREIDHNCQDATVDISNTAK